MSARVGWKRWFGNGPDQNCRGSEQEQITLSLTFLRDKTTTSCEGIDAQKFWQGQIFRIPRLSLGFPLRPSFESS